MKTSSRKSYWIDIEQPAPLSFLASGVAVCFPTSGMPFPFSSILTPSSFNKLYAFHLPAQLIPGSIYSIVYGIMDHVPKAAKIYKLRAFVEGAKHARMALESVPLRMRGGTKRGPYW